MAVWTTPNAEEIDGAGRWDAEAFTPVLRELDARFRESPKLYELATVTHAAEITRTYSNAADSKLFLLAQNIRPLLPDTSTEFRITKQTADAIPVNRLNHADVLVTRSGAHSGMCAVYLGADGECYTSGEGLIIRSRTGIDGAYLAAFFNTSAGEALCRRAVYGSGQPHIGPKYLEQVRVPRLGKIEEQASKLVRAAYDGLRNAEKLYPEAEAELLDRLGWNNLQRAPVERSYVCNFADLATSARFDPEYYRPGPHGIRKWLAKNRAQSIGELCHFAAHGLQPDYVQGGTIGIVSQRQFRASGLNLDLLENFTTQSFIEQNPTFRIRKGDVLVYCVSAGEYLGRTFLFNSDIPCVAASFVTILRTKQVVPGYLALFLNSPLGLLQSNMFKRGTSPFYLYPRDLKQVLISIPRQKNGSVDLAWQQGLAAKVEVATSAKAAARAKLEEAKRLVEAALR